MESSLHTRLWDEIREYKHCSQDKSLTETTRDQCERIAEQLQYALDELQSKGLRAMAEKQRAARY